MRKIAAWGLGVSLLVGLGIAAAGAADDIDGGSTKPWAPTWQWKPFSTSASSKEDWKPVEKKPPPKPQTTEKKPASVKPARVVDEAAERSREETALLRRLQACDKLKDIAIRTDDKDLLRRAEALEERAQAAYAQRTARLRGGGDRFESDEKTIDRFLGASKPKEAVSYTVSGTDHSNQAAAKEVKP